MGAGIVNIVLGLWLMISPQLLNMSQASSDNNYIIGPLVITFSIIALWEINRNAIKVNIVLGLWLLVALFVMDYNGSIVIMSNALSAILIIILSSLKRKSQQSYGGGWRSLFQENPLHLQEAEKESSGS